MSLYLTAPDGTSEWLTRLFMRLNGLAFSATLSGTQIVGTGSPTKLALDTLEFDSTGGFDTTNNKWTCKQGGLYTFTIKCAMSNTLDSTKSFTLDIYKNGVSVAKNVVTATANTPTPHFELTKTLKLNKTDYIEVYTTNTNAVSANISSATTHTYFQGKRVT